MYLFDTDVLSNLMKARPSERLLHKLKQIDPELQVTSSITMGELFYGAFLTSEPARIIIKIESVILPSLKVLPFDENAAREYGRIRAQLQRKGFTISEPDIRIAAICLSNDAILVTGNIKHFCRIKGLKTENWI